MHVSATYAKNRFGTICAHAKRSPVTILKDGLPDTVILSFDEFQTLCTQQTQSPSQRKKEFQETYKEWFDAYNADVEKNGIWCAEGMAWGTNPLKG